MLILLLANLVLFFVGVWVGSRTATAKYEAEIEELKKQPVKVKVVQPHTVQVVVDRRYNRNDVIRFKDPREAQEIVKEEMVIEMGRKVLQLARFAQCRSIETEALNVIDFKAVVNVLPYEEGV